MKVVLDTNVLISAIFWGGKPIELFEHAINERISFYATTDIMHEYFRLIEKIGKGKEGHINAWKMKLMDIVNIVETNVEITDCRDPKDNMFLECAVSAGAKVIVSGDNDLLVLNPFRGISILKVNEFLKEL